MKKYLFSLFVLTAHVSLLEGYENAEQITFESLASSLVTDHVSAFKVLFEIQPVGEFLEFGMGLGTKYFLDHCQHVTSIELLIKDRSSNVLPWYLDCLELYKNYANWTPALQVFPQAVNQANDFAIREMDPEMQSREYLNVINKFLDQVFQYKRFEVVFVDPGMHIRGDLVNALFGRADIIVAHDTNSISSIYGWYKIRVPDDYEQVTNRNGSGITFWIRKNKGEVIAHLKRAFEKN